MAMNSYMPNLLGFDTAGFMNEFDKYLNIALDRLSYSVQELMKREIKANGNGSKDMRDTAANQVHEISRKINGDEVELVVGIEEDKLGGFTSQVFVRTAVVLHGNVAWGPLMTKPGRMTWKKNVNYMSMSPTTNKDGTPKKPKVMPMSFMQYEKVNGFGSERHMLDNVFNNQVNHVIDDFYNVLGQLVNNIDYSQFITGG